MHSVIDAPTAGAPKRRRGRPQTITSEQLLDVAREVFLERGIRATTVEVARRAGISEGTLFHRFGTKETLFREALHYDPALETALLAELPVRAGERDVRETLADIGRQFLDIGTVALPLMMMEWSNPDTDLTVDRLASTSERRTKRGVDALRAFFAAEQERGRIAHDVDVHVLARTYVGTLHHYCLQELLLGSGASRAARDRFIRATVDLLFDGCCPAARRRASARSTETPAAGKASDVPRPRRPRGTT